jgi:hypothetical protein
MRLSSETPDSEWRKKMNDHSNIIADCFNRKTVCQFVFFVCLLFVNRGIASSQEREFGIEIADCPGDYPEEYPDAVLAIINCDTVDEIKSAFYQDSGDYLIVAGCVELDFIDNTIKGVPLSTNGGEISDVPWQRKAIILLCSE